MPRANIPVVLDTNALARSAAKRVAAEVRFGDGPAAAVPLADPASLADDESE